MPPKLTHPPGASSSMPGVFKYSSGIVHVVDLRKRFGVDDEDKCEPGRIVVVEVEGGHAGIWVDEIIDVIQFPSQGWGPVPAHIPRNVFSKTLLYDKKIMLYADFDLLHKFKDAGYLRQHIEVLKKEKLQKQSSVKPVLDKPMAKKSVAKDLPEKEYAAHVSPAAMVTSKPETIQEKDVGSDSSEKSYQSHGQISEVAAKHNKAKQPASSVSITQSKSVVMQREESRLSKPVTHPKNKIEPIAVAASNKIPSYVSSRSKNINNNKPPGRSKASPAAISRVDKKENNHLVDDSINDVFATTPVARTKASAENNMAFWMLGVVIMAMLVVMYFSFDNMFPENKKEPSNEISGLQELAPVVETVDVQSYEESVIEPNAAKPVVDDNPVLISKTSIASIRENALDDYRADIAHNKNDIVIVLQQPEDEADVLKEEADESNAKIQNQNDEVSLQDAGEKNNDALIDVVWAPVQNARNDPEIISPALRMTESPVDDADVSEKPVSNQSVNAPGETQIELPATQAVETQKQTRKKQVVHIVVKGDTLWHIAKRYIKNPYKYPELARLSKIKNPDLIYPGNKVIIIIETKKTKQVN